VLGAYLPVIGIIVKRRDDFYLKYEEKKMAGKI
jgi:hypothetical protein